MNEDDKKQEYISVGELSVGFSENIVQPTDALVGKEVKLYYESGKKATITFIDVEALKWETEEQGREEKSFAPTRLSCPVRHLSCGFYRLLWR